MRDKEEASKLLKLLNTCEEIAYRVSEALMDARSMRLMQVERVLETIKSYLDLLKRELEVKIEDLADQPA
ncbi:MAG: hypothetical protein N3F04_02595 [Candidatus Nezhaarchaeota archaeon]|nr:hypothetical protein [Candidatus Nezhaarchaeota archaeon]MCX8141659.1 hypothetical protein [Candidatus Nezhaarchaeota archaeon]MDW8049926.1 hypothetical protein [Nitrososphaerota archaeon]